MDTSDPARPAFAWSGSGFEARFQGTGISAELANQDGYLFLVFVDTSPARKLVVTPGRRRYVLASDLAPGPHSVLVTRQSEGQAGPSRLLALSVQNGTLLPPPFPKGRALEVVGDSISCGYGNLGTHATCPFSYATESHWHTYAAIAARELGAELSTIAVSGAGMARNLDGGTVDTMPMLYDRAMTGEPRVAWVPTRAPDVIVVNLGTNDFFPGDPGLVFEDVYADFLQRLRHGAPRAFIVLALGPMLFDDAYGTGVTPLSNLRRRLHAILGARQRAGDQNIALLEFPKDQPADYGCDYHPNAQKHAAMAQQLAQLVRAKLGW